MHSNVVIGPGVFLLKTGSAGATLPHLAEGTGGLAREEVLRHMRTASQKAERELSRRCLRLPDMVWMLMQVIAILQQVFICIDGLHE